MKSFICRSFVLLCLLSTVGVHGIHAQLPPNGVKFKTTFPFVAGTETFPAGTYTIMPSQDDLDILTVSSATGHSGVTYCEEFDTNAPAAKTEATFNKYGTTRYLKQISVSGSNEGCTVATGNAEKKAKKSGKPTKEAVEAK